MERTRDGRLLMEKHHHSGEMNGVRHKRREFGPMLDQWSPQRCTVRSMFLRKERDQRMLPAASTWDRQTTHRIGRRRENWAPIVTLGGYDRSSCTTTRSSARYLTCLGSLGPVRRSVEEGEIAPMREQRSLTRSNTPSSFQNPGRPPFFSNEARGPGPNHPPSSN